MNAITADLASTTSLTTSFIDNDDDGLSATGYHCSVELLRQSNDTHFSKAAPDMLANGWSVFPQDVDRRPSLVYGQRVKWQADHKLATERATPEVFQRWLHMCATSNVACVMGAASGNVFCVDIDITDEELSNRVQAIVDKVLGYSPLRRVGMFPKIALFYRTTASDTVATVAKRFAGRDDALIEIQGHAKLMTFHGAHHKTGDLFKWLDKSPINVGPDTAPLVTSERVHELLAELDAEFGFVRATTRAANIHDITSGDSEGVTLPLLSVGEKWAYNSEGLVSNGREQYLTDLCFATGRLNREDISAAITAGEDALNAVIGNLAAAVERHFIATTVADHKARWQGANLRSEVASRIHRIVAKMGDGKLVFHEAEIIAKVTKIIEVAEWVPIDLTGAKGHHAETLDDVAARVEAIHHKNLVNTAKTAERKAKLAAEDAAAARQRANAGVTGDDMPMFSVLGHDHGKFFVMGRGGQVNGYTSKALDSASTLMEFASLEYWQDEFCGAKGGIDTKAAANSLMEAAYKVGIYNPDSMRGRGIHIDGDKVIAHLGHKLIIIGEDGVATEKAPGAFRGRRMYELARPMNVVLGKPRLTDEEGQGLVDLCNSLPLAEGCGSLLAGWLTIAPACGAMTWRPHAWLTGEPGSGKSWAIENIVNPIVGAIALRVQGQTTEAGIRGELRLDARPVIFDEAETQTKTDALRMQANLNLARAASEEDGADILKGRQDGGVNRFCIRSAFFFSSINVGMTQAADESRTIVFELRPTATGDARVAAFKEIQDIHKRVMTPEFGSRLLSRTLTLLPTIRHNAEVIAQAIARSGRTRRTGDTLGVPLAGMYSLTHADKLTADAADKWLAASPWVANTAKVTETTPEWRKALDLLLQIVIRVETEENKSCIRVAELISAANGTKVSAVTKEDAEGALKNIGIRIDSSGAAAKVWIANSSKEIAAEFEHSDWGKGWTSIIRRAPMASAPDKACWFGEFKSRFTEVPLWVAMGFDKEGTR